MYGTIARLRPKAGHLDQIRQVIDEEEQQRPIESVRGFVADYVFQLDDKPDELMLVAIFQDRETYRANADDPAQDRWYRRLREHLESDPEWMDGEVVDTSVGRASGKVAAG